MWRNEVNWPIEGHHDSIAAHDRKNGEMVQEAHPDHSRVAKSGLLAKVGLSYRQGGASILK
jgi:DNA-binding GntR family transcriptional regulator